VQTALLGALLALVATATCGYGDRGFGVTMRNETDGPIIITALGVTNDPVTVYTLEPGRSVARTWQYPNGSGDPRRVRVTASNGARLYCRDYSYDDIRAAEFTIRIREGEIACQ